MSPFPTVPVNLEAKNFKMQFHKNIAAQITASVLQHIVTVLQGAHTTKFLDVKCKTEQFRQFPSFH